MKAGDWSWLELTKILTGVLTPLTILLVTFWINENLRRVDAENQREAAVIDLSEVIYARRVRAELLASGLRRHSADPSERSLVEIIERKTAYDEAYVDWNKRSQSNLLVVRGILETRVYTALEAVVELHLVGEGFRPLDSCLTAAYDDAIRGRDTSQTMEACDVNGLQSFVLNCSYAISDELFAATSSAIVDREGSVFQSGQIAARCGVPASTPRFQGIIPSE